MESNIITILPNASSLIESMRSIGYSFETALADIIDNSISSGANEIQIFQRVNNNKPYVQIVDNGSGMDDDELIEAMRLGSKNPLDIRDKNDLGRFGIGLKSASFSQCRKLTVISKKNAKTNGYQWDLDLVKKTDSFNIRRLSKEEKHQIINVDGLFKLENGTIVQWEDFDRIQDSTNDLSDELAELMNKSAEHISLIFHRFLENGLKISVNFEPVLPKDPFLVNHIGTQELKDKKVSVDGEIIHLYPYVIPHFSKLSAADQRKSGKVNEQYKAQGFYLYRNKRLIVWGDYLGLTKKSELGKNVRIKVDIPNNLDYLWEIDVKKSRASVPSKIKKNLLSAISDSDVVSRNVNTYRGKKELTEEKTLWQFYSGRDDSFHFELNSENELYIQFVNNLDENQKRMFDIFSTSIAANIPYQAIYSQIGNGSKSNEIFYEDDSLISSLKETVDKLKLNSNFNTKAWLQSLVSENPYASNKEVIEFIKEELEN